MVKDGQDLHGLQMTKLKNYGPKLSDAQSVTGVL